MRRRRTAAGARTETNGQRRHPRCFKFAMASDPLFQIEGALAAVNDAQKLAALSPRQIVHAFLAGAYGTRWRANFLQVAGLASDHGQSMMSCCALLAEILVEAADASEIAHAALENATEDAASAAVAHKSAAPAAASLPAAAPTRNSPPAKRARTSNASSTSAAEPVGASSDGERSAGSREHETFEPCDPVVAQLARAAEVLVDAADASVVAHAALENATAVGAATGAVARKSAAPAAASLRAAAPTPNPHQGKEARTSNASGTGAAEPVVVSRGGGRCAACREHEFDPMVSQLVSLIRSHGRGATTEFIMDFIANRQHILKKLPAAGITTKRPFHYGECPAGHFSVRNAWGSGGRINAFLPRAVTSAIKFGQKDRNRKYADLGWGPAKTAKIFAPLQHAIGFETAMEPSVLANGVGSRAPCRQDLHVDGAPSAIIPVQSTGCLLDCLMQPDLPDTAEDYLLRVTVFVPFGHCVVFNAFHGGSKGNYQSMDKRVHVFLNFGNDIVSKGNLQQRTLKEMLARGDPGVRPFLERVPTKEQLQKLVGYSYIAPVCKVNPVNGDEFEPFSGHNG